MLPGLAFYADIAVVLLHNGFGDEEPQATALWFAMLMVADLCEAVEDQLLLLFGYPLAIVFHLDDCAAPVQHMDVQLHFRASKLNGIRQKVDHGLCEPVVVPCNSDLMLWKEKPAVQLLFFHQPLQPLERFLCQGIEVDGARLENQPAGQDFF